MSITSIFKGWKDIFRQIAHPVPEDGEDGDELFLDAGDGGEETAPAESPLNHREEAETSPHRLSLSHSKRTIFDFAHILPPFDTDLEGSNRRRWQLKEAMRQAVLEKASEDESIISFAALIVLCGFCEDMADPAYVIEPIKAVEFAEKYYKRTILWKKAVEAGKPEDERINLSKAVYAAENTILSALLNNRTLYDRVGNPPPPSPPPPAEEPALEEGPSAEASDLAGSTTAAGKNGAAVEESPSIWTDPSAGTETESGDLETPGEADAGAAETGGTGAGEPASGAEPEAAVDGSTGAESEPAPEPEAPPPPRFPDTRSLYAYRERMFVELKLRNVFEEAYISYKEKATERVGDDKPRDDKGGGFSMEAMMQLVAAMGMFQGGVRPAAVDSGATADAQPAPVKRLPARKLRTDGFTVEDKDKLIRLIYSCEAAGTKFDRDAETLEAMVYRKPHQVVQILAEKVEDPILFA
jgi:hypothetical protein